MSNVRNVFSISQDLADQIATAALEEAQKTDKSFSISIVDEGGNLKRFVRQDGAKLNSVQVSQDKAYTAASSGMPTQQWSELLKKDEVLATGAPTAISRLVTMGGGLPIVVEGNVVGGLGVSGAHWTDDVKVALAGLSVLDR